MNTQKEIQKKDTGLIHFDDFDSLMFQNPKGEWCVVLDTQKQDTITAKHKAQEL